MSRQRARATVGSTGPNAERTGGKLPSPVSCGVPFMARYQTTQPKNQERNQIMKLTKNDIKAKRSELVNVLLQIEKLKNDKTSLEKTLAPDFETNEAAYRNGVVTDNGILIRKASWKCTAKPIVEVA
jgi:hypothetical protein